MATIRTSIQIQDNMSRAFQSMNTAMNVVLSSFEALQTASSRAVDTNSIQLARQELMRAEMAFNEIEQEINEANQAQQRFNNEIRAGTSATDGLLQKVMAIAATYLSLRTAGNVIALSDELTNTTARLDMVNSQYQDMVADINNLHASANIDINVDAPNIDTTNFDTAVQQMNSDLNNLNTTTNVDLSVAASNVDTASLDAATSQLGADLNNLDASANIDLNVNAQNIDTANISEQLHGIPIAAEISMTGATSGVDSINAGLQTTEQLQQKIFDSAQRSYGSYQDTAALVGKLGLNAADAFSSTDEIIGFSELLNKQFGIAGTNAEGVKNATLQLTQALGGGILRGQELNSIFEHAPNIIHTIADYLDVPLGKIREMAGDGQISAEVVKNAMFAAADGINERFESMPLTFEQLWTSFKNEAVWAFRPVLQGINDIANNEKFLAAIETAKSALYTLAAVAMFALNVMTSISGFMYDNWSFIGPVILGVAGIIGILITYLTLARTAILIKTAAIWLWNAALAANPIVWIVMAIAAFVAIVYLAIGAINHFAGTSISATGIVAGTFMILAAYIHNKVAFLWNTFAAFWEYFGNVGKNPVYAAKKLFANLATNVLDQAIAMSSGWDAFATSFVNAMISAVNGAIKAWNWFVDMLPDNIAGVLSKGTEFEYRASVTSDLSHLKDGINDWIGETPADYWEAPKMDMKSLGDAWDTGYDWGANLFGGNQDATGDSYEDLMSGIQGAVSPLTDDGKKTAADTAKMAKSMEASEEDLKYMRDLAERDVINRFTTAEINIDARSENHITEEADVDGIIDKFVEKLEEAAETAAEWDEDDV